MNDALKMQISAFIDGELPENEAELLLRRLSQDLGMRQQVAEYLAIGRCMRRDPAPAGMGELRGRIAKALGEELLPAELGLAEPTSRFVRPALGFALAASVAVLAVIGLRQAVLPDGGAIATQVATPVNDTDPAMTQASPSDVLSEELRHMYLRHSASSADFGANAMITRLVSLELQGGERVRIDPQNSAAVTAAIDSIAPPDDEDSEEKTDDDDIGVD